MKKFIQEKYSRYGKKALIIWLIWLIVKWTVIIISGKAILSRIGYFN
jgi:hypothetical protein